MINEQPSDSPVGILLHSWDNARVPSSLFQVALAMQTPADVCRIIGYMNRVGIAAPLWIYKQGDSRDHTICRIWIEEGDPRIGIPEYWLWSQYKEHRHAYAIYVNRLAEIMGLPIIRQGYTAEREFASVFPPVGQRQAGNTVLKFGELQREFSTIDWIAMLDAAGHDREAYSKATYRVTSRAFLHHFQARLSGWSMNRWRGWFCLIVAQWIAGISPPGIIRDAWFAYNRRFLQGLTTDIPTSELRTAIVWSLMPNTVGKLWIDKYGDKAQFRQISDMCEIIRRAARNAIAATSWMAPSTKKEALEKVRRLRIEVAHPEMSRWVTRETSCSLSPTEYYGNLLAFARASNDINLELGPNCRRPTGGNWSRAVFEVNAFYYPDENRFLLPAAILRAPFWDPKKSLAYNYGSIGATIGHEISHAFDSDGRNFDAKGDKRDWWTADDASEYKKRAAAMVELFETRQYRGMDVDGKQTLVENIADLAGLQFALNGLAIALGRIPTSAEHREFFESYAVSWRAKDRRRRAAQLLATDLHAPPKLRVNHIVRLFDEWYAAYNISEDCSDWIPPAKRIRFFGAD